MITFREYAEKRNLDEGLIGDTWDWMTTSDRPGTMFPVTVVGDTSYWDGRQKVTVPLYGFTMANPAMEHGGEIWAGQRSREVNDFRAKQYQTA